MLYRMGVGDEKEIQREVEGGSRAFRVFIVFVVVEVHSRLHS
jgi:hypothetical protein